MDKVRADTFLSTSFLYSGVILFPVVCKTFNQNILHTYSFLTCKQIIVKVIVCVYLAAPLSYTPFLCKSPSALEKY